MKVVDGTYHRTVRPKHDCDRVDESCGESSHGPSDVTDGASRIPSLARPTAARRCQRGWLDCYHAYFTAPVYKADGGLDTHPYQFIDSQERRKERRGEDQLG